MRTKTLALVAAITAASLAATLAQNVYSLNVVGYVNTYVPSNSVGGGFAILANPLNAATNTLGALIPTAPYGTVVYSYVNGEYQIANFDTELDPFGNPGVYSWDNPDIQLAPGQGFWIKNVEATNLPITFVGEVLQGSHTNLIPSGFSLQGSKVPQALPLWDPFITNPADHGVLDMNYPAAVGSSFIYFYRGGGYAISAYDVGAFNPEEWDNVPVPQVGEGFWVKENAGKTWTRSFSVQ